MRQRCRVSYTVASSCYWPTVLQDPLSLQQVRVEGNVFISSVSSLSFSSFPLSLYFSSSSPSTISSISLLPFAEDDINDPQELTYC